MPDSHSVLLPTEVCNKEQELIQITPGLTHFLLGCTALVHSITEIRNHQTSNHNQFSRKQHHLSWKVPQTSFPFSAFFGEALLFSAATNNFIFSILQYRIPDK